MKEEEMVTSRYNRARERVKKKEKRVMVYVEMQGICRPASISRSGAHGTAPWNRKSPGSAHLACNTDPNSAGANQTFEPKI